MWIGVNACGRVVRADGCECLRVWVWTGEWCVRVRMCVDGFVRVCVGVWTGASLWTGVSVDGYESTGVSGCVWTGMSVCTGASG